MTIDQLLEQIDQTLADCDASRLPSLATVEAAAAENLIEQTGLTVTRWQRNFLRRIFGGRR